MGYCNYHQSLLTIAICSVVFFNLVSCHYPDKFSFETVDLPPSHHHQAPAAAPGGNHGGISDICNACDDPDLCLETVTPYLYGKSDIKSVLGASLKATLEFAKTQNSPDAKNSAGNYSDIMANLQQANDAFNANDLTKVDSILTDVKNKVSSSSSSSSSSSQMSSFLSQMSSMTSNCLSISYRVQG